MIHLVAQQQQSMRDEVMRRLAHHSGFEIAALARVSAFPRFWVRCAGAERVVDFEVRAAEASLDVARDFVAAVDAACESLWSTWMAL